MKNKITTALSAAIILASSISGFAGATATQNVTFQVSAINELAITGVPGTLNIATAVAGGAPISVTDATTSYSITTNELDRKITAAIDNPMPSGVTLQLLLEPPTGASSAPVILGTSAADAVTGISTLNESNKAIQYTLSATSAAGVVPATSRTVILTITAS